MPVVRAAASLPRPFAFASGAAARSLPALLVAALLALPLAADAQWVWRDRDGRVNASDRPPPAGVADKDIVSRPAADAARRASAAAAAAAAAASAAASAAAPPTATATATATADGGAPRPLEAEVQARRRAAEAENARRAKADDDKLAAARAENCRRARSHAAALDSGQRLSRVNPRGEREVLDDRGRAEEMQRAREVIASDCR